MDENLKKKIKELEKRIEKLERFFSNIHDFKIEESDVDEEDEMYVDVLSFVVRLEMVSAVFVQRKFKLGINHVTKIMEQLEKDGVIEAGDTMEVRKVLINVQDFAKSKEEKKRPN